MMHPDFLQATLHDRERQLDRDLRRASLMPEEPNAHEASASSAEQVVLRLCSVHDDEALDRLAALEGRKVASGRHVVAEVDGTLVASLPLASGPLLADPFRHTAHLVSLLELRAKQLQGTGRRTLGVRSAVRGWHRA
jgi:hypothetical protein